MKYTAPELKAVGSKQDAEGSNFYQIPQSVCDIVFTKLGSQAVGAMKLMIVLIGTKPNCGFRLSEDWLMQRTGIKSAKTLSTARQKLVEMGWIEYEPYKYLTIRYDVILGQEEKKKDAATTSKTSNLEKVTTEKSTQEIPVVKVATENLEKVTTGNLEKVTTIIYNKIDKEIIDNNEQISSLQDETVLRELSALVEKEEQEPKEQKEEKVVFMSAVSRDKKQQPQPKRPADADKFKDMFNADGSFKF